MGQYFEKPAFTEPGEKSKVQLPSVEFPASNRVWGRDTHKQSLKLVENMFETYLAQTEVKNEMQIPEHFQNKGEEWRSILDMPEMQIAFQKYLLSHTPEDVENMRDMEELIVAFRDAAGLTAH